MTKINIATFNKGYRQLADYFIGLDSRFTKISDSDIAFDDKFHFSYWWENWDSDLYTTVYIGETPIASRHITRYNNQFNVLTILDDNFAYIETYDPNSNGSIRNIVYVIGDGAAFVGGTVQGFYNVPYYDCSTASSSTFSIPRLFNFIAPPNSIAYIPQAFCVYPDATVAVLPGLHSCSTVTVNSTVTINGNNYFAIGTNTLIELPEE